MNAVDAFDINPYHEREHHEGQKEWENEHVPGLYTCELEISADKNVVNMNSTVARIPAENIEDGNASTRS